MKNLQALNEDLKFDLDLASSDLEVGSFIAPGERENLFSASAESKTRVTGDFNNHVRENLTIVVCYCSVYDDQCEQITIGNPTTERLVCLDN